MDDKNKNKEKPKHRKPCLRILAGKYLVKETIGSGITAKVKRGRVFNSNNYGKKNGKEVAIKIFKPAVMTEPEIRKVCEKEIAILRFLSQSKHRHPNILRLIEVLDNVEMYSKHGMPASRYEKRTVTALVTEYVEGGELYAYLSSGIALDRLFVQAIFQQLVRAVVHLHTNGIVHLDIKPENILLSRSGNVVLSDFGSSQFVQKASRRKSPAFSSFEEELKSPLIQRRKEIEFYIPKSKSMTSLNSTHSTWRQRRLSQVEESRPLIVMSQEGTLEYRAPEVKRQMPFDGAAADVWSLGVVLHVMLYNRLPDINTIAEDAPFVERELPNNLLSEILVIDTLKRPTIKEIANHPWVQAWEIRGSSRIVAAGVKKLGLYIRDLQDKLKGSRQATKEIIKSSSLTSLSSMVSTDSELGSISSI